MVPAFTTSAWLAMPRCTHHGAHPEPLPRTLVKRQAIRHLQLLLGFLWGRIQDWVKLETGDSVDLIWDYTKQGQTYYGFNQHESRIEFVCGLRQMLPLCKNIPVLMMQERELQLVNSSSNVDHYPLMLYVKYGLEFSSSVQDQNATWDRDALVTAAFSKTASREAVVEAVEQMYLEKKAEWKKMEAGDSVDLAWDFPIDHDEWDEFFAAPASKGGLLSFHKMFQTGKCYVDGSQFSPEIFVAPVLACPACVRDDFADFFQLQQYIVAHAQLCQELVLDRDGLETPFSAATTLIDLHGSSSHAEAHKRKLQAEAGAEESEDEVFAAIGEPLPQIALGYKKLE